MTEFVEPFMEDYFVILNVDIKNGKSFLRIHKKNDDGSPGGHLIEKRLTKNFNEQSINSQDMKTLVKRIDKSGTALSSFKSEKVKDELDLILDKMQMDYELFLEDIDKYKEAERKKEHEARLEEVEDEASTFDMILENHDMNLMQYLFFVSSWLVADEQNNVVAAFTAYLTTVLGLNPIWVTIFGSAGGGKTTIEEAALKMIPDNHKVPGVMTYASMFELSRLKGSDYFDKKIAMLGDLGGEKDFERNEDMINIFKELGTDEKPASRVKSMKDPITGEMIPTEFTIEGKAALSLTSVNEMKDTQMISRSIQLMPKGTDESFFKFMNSLSAPNKQTRYRKHLIENELPYLRSYIEKLAGIGENYQVINPYFPCLMEWVKGADNARRSATQIPDLVKVVSLLMMKDNIVCVGDDVYVISTKFDNMMVAEMFNLNTGLSLEAINFYNWLITKVNNDQVIEEVEGVIMEGLRVDKCKNVFTVASIKRRISSGEKKFQRTHVSDYCYQLYEEGLIDKYDDYHGSGNLYSLTENNQPLEKQRLILDDALVEEYMNKYVYDEDYGMEGIDIDLVKTMIQNDTTADAHALDKSKLPKWVL